MASLSDFSLMKLAMGISMLGQKTISQFGLNGKLHSRYEQGCMDASKSTYFSGDISDL
jgi:hypothetical protein